MTDVFQKLGIIQVKADVETQGEFVESLANEVRAASFVNIGDVVAFVNWLDEELSFLVSSPTMFYILQHAHDLQLIKDACVLG